MIGIVDYGAGNLLSVYNAIKYLGFTAQVFDNPSQMTNVERIVLPGVGAFGACMDQLIQRGFVDSLNEHVITGKRPILGICVGMQVMAQKGLEKGVHQGLGWIEGEVAPLKPENNLRIPHIGWDQVQPRSNDNPLFKNIPPQSEFYFANSFSMQCSRPQDVIATCDYGRPFTAAIFRENILAVQFHPEKSQNVGLKLIQNFLEWRP